MPIIAPTGDPRNYGPGILIENGRLDDAEITEIIQEYGEEFFQEEIQPRLRA